MLITPTTRPTRVVKAPDCIHVLCIQKLSFDLFQPWLRLDLVSRSSYQSRWGRYVRVPLSQPLTHAWFSGRKRFAAVFGLKRDVISVADLEVGQALTAEVPSWVVVTAAGLTLGVTVASLGVLPDSHVNYDAGFFFPTSRAASVARVAAYNPFKHPSVTKTFGSVAGWRASAANPRKTPWRGWTVRLTEFGSAHTEGVQAVGGRRRPLHVRRRRFLPRRRPLRAKGKARFTPVPQHGQPLGLQNWVRPPFKPTRGSAHVPSLSSSDLYQASKGSSWMSYVTPVVRYRPGFIAQWRLHRRLFAYLVGASRLRQHRITDLASRFAALGGLTYGKLVACSALHLLWGSCFFLNVDLRQLAAQTRAGFFMLNYAVLRNPLQSLTSGDILWLGTRALPFSSAPSAHVYTAELALHAAVRRGSAACLDLDLLFLGFCVLPTSLRISVAPLAPLTPFLTLRMYNWKYRT